IILGMIIGNFVVLAPGAKTPISEVAEIGVLLLLFLIGLDLDLERFKEMVLPASGVAFGGVVLPFIFGYFAAIFFGFSVLESLFIGASLVATSVGVSASILHESGKLRSKVGTLIMDSAVADDVIAIIIMTVILSFATTGLLQITEIFILGLSSILFFVISLTVGVLALREISERIPIGEENLILGGLVMILAFALITEEIGLAAIIGAFVSGLVIGQTHFAKSLAGPISTMGKGFFIPIFFVSMGMGFDFGAFSSIGFFAVVLIILAIVGKVIGCSLGAKIFGFGNKESVATGIAMIPRGEVALIIASSGFERGFIGADVVSILLIIVIVTTIVTPTPLWEFLKDI
ncbi:MAG: cation:proton antiporter, partial [Hadesarchaea archaeon]|nr:cation:proton antiporter [Hadesarchaea archaeon]